MLGNWVFSGISSENSALSFKIKCKCLLLQVIIYVDDANDEVPVFTQQQYNRLGLKETAGIGTSVIVVRATDPDTGESDLTSSRSTLLV